MTNGSTRASIRPGGETLFSTLPKLGLVMGLICAPALVLAQETDRWRFRQFQVENDVFPVPYSQPGDRFYTNGLRISLGRGVFAPGADESDLPFWLRPVRNRCSGCQIVQPRIDMDNIRSA